jgi:SAM-dependent methyltransferase
VHAALLDLAAEDGFGDVLDLGCGRGQLGIALLEAGAARAVIGIDWNAAHLGDAARAAAGLAFRAERRDLGNPGALPRADTVLIIDMLYQLHTAAQHALLEAAATAARRRILIRTADPARGWRSTLTRTLERIARPFWPHSGAHVNARAPAAIAAMLQARGFRVSVAPCWAGTPFANVLLRAERSA